MKKRVQILNAIELLQSEGYFIFPRAQEGNFPDISGFKGELMSCGNVGTYIAYDSNVVAKINEGYFITSDNRLYNDVYITQEQKVTNILEKMTK